MNNESQKYVEKGSADQVVARTKDNAIGTDDIGLPSDVVPDGAGKPDEIKPDPDKAGPQH